MLRSRVVNSAPQSKPSNTSTTTSEVRLNASATSRQRPTTLTLCKTAAFAATLTLSTAWLVLLLLATTIFVPETYNNQKYTTVSLDSLLSSQTPTHLRSNANANTNTNTNTNKIQQNSADQPLLPFRNVFVAANFYNSEDILTTLLPQIGRFAATLHQSKHHQVFVSLQENGSRDSTAKILQAFGTQLNQAGIANKMLTTQPSDSGDWREYCKESGVWRVPSWNTSLPPECATDSEVCRPPMSLRKCEHGIRIPVMATIRNKALLPLKQWKQEQENLPTMNGDQQPQHTSVLFVNDVRTTAEDMLRLIGGKNSYDMMCGTDFEGYGLYDLWVARDVHGQFLSEQYPYFQQFSSRHLMLNGLPVPMYSCWNGMVSINATTLGNQMFRSWVEGETRTPIVSSSAQREQYGRNDGRCAASECQLVCKDLWTATNNNAKIYMHPGVKLYYNYWSFLLHRWVAPVTEMFIRWRAPSLKAQEELSFPKGPPLHVPCGSGTDGCDSGRVLMPAGHKCRYV